MIYVVCESIESYDAHSKKLLKAFRNKNDANKYHEKKCLETAEDNQWCYENGIDEIVIYSIEEVTLE